MAHDTNIELWVLQVLRCSEHPMKRRELLDEVRRVSNQNIDERTFVRRLEKLYNGGNNPWGLRCEDLGGRGEGSDYKTNYCVSGALSADELLYLIDRVESDLNTDAARRSTIREKLELLGGEGLRRRQSARGEVSAVGAVGSECGAPCEESGHTVVIELLAHEDIVEEVSELLQTSCIEVGRAADDGRILLMAELERERALRIACECAGAIEIISPRDMRDEMVLRALEMCERYIVGAAYTTLGGVRQKRANKAVNGKERKNDL